MTTNEKMIAALEEQIEKIQFQKFCHECKDRWDADDYRIHNGYIEKIRTLQKQIEALS